MSKFQHSAKMNKLVSIVLTTLNGARYLRQSIDSCLEQTYPNLELIVVDGGSTDGTLEIVQSYTDPRIRLLHQLNNEGMLSGALNLGLADAKGDYLTWHQDDCYYAPDAIEVMVRTLEEHPEVGQVYTDWWMIYEDGRQEVIQVKDPQDLSMAKSDPIGVCFMIRREVREMVGEHTVESFPCQDYEFRLRVVRQFKSLRIPHPYYFYRFHPYSLTGRLGWPQLSRKDAEIRLNLGMSTKEQYRRDLAEVDIAEAFECYSQNQFRRVPWLIISGLRKDISHINNRGVWSILLRSILSSSS